MADAPGNPAAQARVRDAVLEAAARVLAEPGGPRSVADVAAAAGVGRATLYRYFPSRADLLDALARQAVAEAGRRLEAADLDAVDVAEALARIVRALVSVGHRYVVVVREHVSIDPDELERTLRRHVRAVMERGQRDGTLRRDLSVDWLVTSLAALITTGVQHAALRGVGDEQISADVVSHFLTGACSRSR
jgi:TetR/AcrR family transcriptional regulator, mexCD-oprJ operon repressor